MNDVRLMIREDANKQRELKQYLSIGHGVTPNLCAGNLNLNAIVKSSITLRLCVVGYVSARTDCVICQFVVISGAR